MPHSEGPGFPVGLFASLLVATLVAYGPALTGELLWDDAGHVTRPDLRSWEGLLRIWFEPGATQQYYPLLHSAFWIQHHLWGDATLGYHLITVVWHAAAAGLLALLLRRLAVPGAVLAAFAFALHPVAVESVAWISEQKNTLSTLFYLAAALAWLRNEDDRRPLHGAVATLCFVAALLTKTVTATLPAALLVLAWWRRGRLSWRGDVVPLLPWLALGVAAGSVTAWLEATQIGASGSDFTLGAMERGLLAGRVVWFYVGKLLWPFGLTFFYPRWSIDAGNLGHWLWPLAALAVLALGAVWSRRGQRGPLAAALLFGGTLFPVLGFVNVYPFIFSYVADHFQYLASLWILAFLSAAAVTAYGRLGWSPFAGRALAAAVLLFLGGLSWRQSGQYRDVLTLYETTVARNPDSWVARLNLGTTLDDLGHPDEALPHLQRAHSLKPDYPEILNSLGGVLNQLGRVGEAQPLLERAVQLQPRFAAAHNTRGVSLIGLGRMTEGLAAFEQALALAPELTTARINLAWGLANSGRLDDAVRQFGEAQRREPDHPGIDSKWGLAYIVHQRFDDALPHLRRAVERQPDDPDARQLLGRLLLQLGRSTEAAAEFEAALAIDPDHAGAREGLQILQSRRPR